MTAFSAPSSDARDAPPAVLVALFGLSDDVATRSRPHLVVPPEPAEASPAAEQDAPAPSELQELRAGVQRGEFVLHYQPVVDLERQQVVGVEALLRWQHPQRGLLLPAAFLPLAEASGLMVELGAWVLEEACRQGVLWRDAGLVLEVAANVSATQICHPGFAQDVEHALASSGLDPRRLLLEVTESAMLTDVDAAAAVLTAVALTGASVAVDDFGTGYSSLTYLRRYPVSALKIDCSFVSGLGEHRDDDAIVASIVSLAQALDAVCTAEGVETVGQHAQLLVLGCARAQGSLFSMAVPPDRLPETVRAVEALALPPRPGHRAPHRGPERLPDDVLQQLLRMHRAGDSSSTIAAALNRARVKHPRGVRWHHTAVAQWIAAAPVTDAVDA